MRGFAHIIVVLVMVTGLGVGLYLVQQKTNLLSQAFTDNPLSSDQEQTTTVDFNITPTSSSNKNSSTFISIFDRLRARGNTAQSPTPTTTPLKITTPTPKTTSTSAPAATPTPTSAPTPTPTPVTPSTCGVNALAQPLDINQSFDNLLTAYLGYSVSYKNTKSVTGVQWDFDGNGTWDTDMSMTNASVDHTFPSYGNFNVKLHLKMSDGEITPVCSKTVTVPLGIEVKLSGRVYSDDNCNDYLDLNEAGISGAPVNIYLEKSNSYINKTTDTSGNYEVTRIIDPTNYVLIQSTTEAIGGYTLHSSSRNQVQTYTLSNSQRQLFVDLSQVPLTSVDLCQAY